MHHLSTTSPVLLLLFLLLAAIQQQQTSALALSSPPSSASVIFAMPPPSSAGATRAATPTSTPPLARRPVVLLLGDSLTERGFDPDNGWAAALAHALSRRADVACRGLSGWNSRWALKAARRLARGALGLPTAVVAKDGECGNGAATGAGAGAGAAGTCAAEGGAVAAAASAQPPPPRELLFATLWFGANDAALPDRGAKVQHVPVDEYERNVEAIAREAIAAAAEANKAAAAAAAAGDHPSPLIPPRPVRLLIITPPPVAESARVAYQRQRMAEEGDPLLAQYEGKPLDQGPLPDRTTQASRLYADAALRVARRLRKEFGGGGGGGGVIVAALDLHAALLPAVEADGGWGREVLTDGLHFTGKGAAEVGRLVAAAVEREGGGEEEEGGGNSGSVFVGGLGLGPLAELPAHLPLWNRLAAPGWEAALDEFFA